MDESDRDKLDTIVGKAIKALALSGASDAEIGAFAFKHREEIAQVLGLSPAPPPTPTNEELIQTLASVLRDSMAQAGTMVGKKRPINVVCDGMRTSISLSSGLLERLAEATGSEKAAKKEIQRLVNSMPKETPNRSAWLTARIEHALLFKTEMPDTANMTSH